MKKMMKALVASLLVAFTSPLVSIKANENQEVVASHEVIDLGNGYTKEITVTETKDITRASTKTGTKTYKYKNGDTILWTASVTGTFSYNGSTSSCTKASASSTSYNSSWKIIDYYATRSSATATTHVTAKRYFLGIPVQTVNDTISLTCSKNGTLS